VTQLMDPILGTALAGQADILCTRHADLLAEDIRQCCATKGVRAVTDLEVPKGILSQAEWHRGDESGGEKRQ